MTVSFPEPGKLKATSSLDMSVRVLTIKGWLELQSKSGYPYRIGRNSFSESARTQRRTTVTNPFVKGSFTVASVPENIEETVEVWVSGDSHYEMEAALDVLVEAFEQTNFLLERRIEDSWKRWFCQAADVTVRTQAEYLHSKIAMLTATIPRLPTEERGMG